MIAKTKNLNNVSSRTPKPSWVKVKTPKGDNFTRLMELKRSKYLHTVCEEARCPNIGECWGRGTATFLILGSICTRNCRFCDIQTGSPKEVDWREPIRVAEAVAAMGLRHIVITSVTRDDLSDGGASVFAETIREIRLGVPGCTVEVLIPDFKGARWALELVLDAKPEILNHNVETVNRLYQKVRPQARYQRSLEVLKVAKEINPKGLTKSGFMVGLGETWDEIVDMMYDLRKVSCNILTIGQYLRPSQSHLPITRFYPPEEFEALKKAAYAAGFNWVESGPLVRSSYGADRQVHKLRITRFGS